MNIMCTPSMHEDTQRRPKEAETWDWNVCACPSYIVTSIKQKDTENYIAEYEAVRFNIKLLMNIPIKDKRPRLRDVDGLSLESLHENTAITMQCRMMEWALALMADRQVMHESP